MGVLNYNAYSQK
jgi:hypothetical protein